MTLCKFNTRLVKNKNADIVDYVCDCKADLFAITETQLSADDAAVRVELCPDGTSLQTTPALHGRGGGGTGLVYRSSQGIKKVHAGERASFEFYAWIVASPSLHNLLLVIIIYRPP